ncbi:MAG: glutamate synthase-related protein [Candidatus Micrarchaeia archaeon]
MNEKKIYFSDRRHYNWDVVSNTSIRSDHYTSNGICVDCTKCGICEVGLKAKTGRTIFPQPFGLQFGAEKRLPNLNDIQILPEIFGEEVFFREVDTSCRIGGFRVKVPLVIAALGSTKVAYVSRKELSSGAAKAGIIRVVGENVLPTYGKEGLKECVLPFLENYDGNGAVVVQANVIDEKMNVPEIAAKIGAHAIEIKLGQGSKQGLGGEVRVKSKKEAKKYEEIGYKIIESKGDYERHTPPGSIKKDEIEKKIEKYKKLGLKIWVKVGFGRGILDLLEFLDGMVDAVTIDGHGGGTGMSPWLIMNETSLPSCAVFGVKRKKFNFDLIVAGGICDGINCAKAIMLGADGVAMGRAFLIAAGQPNGVVNFTNAIKEELQMVCAVLRKKSVREIRGLRKNLFALSKEAKELFGLTNEI